MTESVVVEIETYLRQRSGTLTDPVPGECLACYVARMTSEFGCDNTLRWAARFREVRAPRVAGLEKRLGDMGGFCDCEILINGYQRSTELDEGCLGARGGSTKPCQHWQRHRWW